MPEVTANENEMKIDELDLTEEQKKSLAGVEPGVYFTFETNFEEDGNVTVGITPVPCDLRIFRDMQTQLAAEMQKANLKIVIYKGVVYLCPYQTTSLIGLS